MNSSDLDCTEVAKILALEDLDRRVDHRQLERHLDACRACRADAFDVHAFLHVSVPNAPLPAIVPPRPRPIWARAGRRVAAAAIVATLVWVGSIHESASTPAEDVPAVTVGSPAAGRVRTLPSHYSTSEAAVISFVRGQRTVSEVRYTRPGPAVERNSESGN